MKILKEEIIEILKKVDDMHTDGYLMPDYQDKLADQIIQSLLNRLPKERDINPFGKGIEHDINCHCNRCLPELSSEGYNTALKEITEIIKGI